MTGIEWVIEAYGCRTEGLRNLETIKTLFARIIDELDLHPCGDAQWQQFPQSGGITGICLLSESHLACHTFPEFSSLCLNLFCCRPRPAWDFEACLRQMLGAETVNVRRLERRYMDPAEQASAAVHFLSGGLRTRD